MAELNQVKEVIKKIAGYKDVGEHVCFFGGSMPYILQGEESHRDHSDIDILVDEEFTPTLREYLKETGIYRPNRDSTELDLDKDYGAKMFIDGIYVEFEPMRKDNNELTRLSFNPDKKIAGQEVTPFLELTDLIIPATIDGVKIYSETPELIKAGKEIYKREKDLKDVAFINQTGFDQEKYDRVKIFVNNSKTEIQSFEEIKKNKGNSI